MNKCEICGNEITKKAKFKPYKYCSPECNNYSKYKPALEKALLLINPTVEQRAIIRGDMFRLANILSKRTNT